MADNKTLDLETFIHMISNGIKFLVEKYKYIDELNVFPVPDGDTGTNMKITFEGGHKAIQGVDFADFFLLGKTFNRGLLMNARGNSGVISSQIFKGFFKAIPEGKKELNIADIAECLKGAKETAYKAVITPIEGTILTVIRTVAETVSLKLSIIKNIADLFCLVTDSAEKALANTPNLLPELKEAGVVDSGGYGLCRIFEGMRAVINEGSASPAKQTSKSFNETKKIFDSTPSQDISKTKEEKFEDNNEGFGYCNEFIMEIGSKVTHEQKNKEKFDFTSFKKQLAKMGDSIVCVVDDDLVKLHIHSTSP
jgi:DAK2 domain fusion protein YloV